MTVPGTLKAQFDLYETLSAGAEAWKRDHQDAMFCREIEEAVSIGLAILANIRRRSDRWADDVERGKIPFSWEEARDLDELHKWWLHAVLCFSKPLISVNRNITKWIPQTSSANRTWMFP